MKLYLLLLFLISDIATASQFEPIDKSINMIIQSWLSNATSSVPANRSSCNVKTVSLTSLEGCHKYITGIYITEDIDSYLSYVKQLSYFGAKAQSLSIFEQIIAAQYEETTSKLYFHIAHAAYLNQRYDESIKFLKKIDDTLDDESVYHALLIYGLIYFEKGDFKKSKQYLERVDSSSKHYAAALYNIGLISMRSLWWSDAEFYLNKAVQTFNKKDLSKEDVLVLDKLYLTIGYSQMSRKNFRASMKSFSSISLTSSIKMRGLMGIALSEIGLGNVGKAATILKHINNKSSSTVKLDALVTLPQVYQKAGNIKETVKYYDSAIIEMNGMSNRLDKNIAGNNINDYALYEFDSDWFIKKVNHRIFTTEELLSKNSLGVRAKNKLKNIRSKLESIKASYITGKNKQILNVINDYIKQSKYALAVIYDKSVVSK